MTTTTSSNFSSFSISMKQRTAAVCFLSAISMLGVFVWWGRLPKNTSSIRERYQEDSSPLSSLLDEEEGDFQQQETPPSYLFTSDWTSDNDEEENPAAANHEGADDVNYKQGERIRGKVAQKKINNLTNKSNNMNNNIKKKAKQEAAAATSMDVSSLETASDSKSPSQSQSQHLPKMVWLMSYPNSGTSYTMMMVGRASQRATASNYGREVAEPGVINTPLYPDQYDGPFYRPNPKKPLPTDYILVKTHCGGRCVTCGPDKYVINEADFLDECRRGSGFFGHSSSSSSSSDSKGNSKRMLQEEINSTATNANLEDGDDEEDNMLASGDGDRTDDDEEEEESSVKSIKGTDDEDEEDGNGLHTVHYDANLVKKAIHLYRNPFHNVVSRFHLERKHYVERNHQYEINRYPNNSTGFQRWCKDLNKLYGPTVSKKKNSKKAIRSSSSSSSSQQYLEPEIVELMQKVPCHGEMYKYIQWHNMAYNVTAHSNKPTHIVHYENYDKKWNQTVTKILDFLHLDFVGVHLPFTARHDYDPYFSNSQRRATKALIQRLASAPVWQQVERYFD